MVSRTVQRPKVVIESPKDRDIAHALQMIEIRLRVVEARRWAWRLLMGLGVYGE